MGAHVQSGMVRSEVREGAVGNGEKSTIWAKQFLTQNKFFDFHIFGFFLIF